MNSASSPVSPSSSGFTPAQTANSKRGRCSSTRPPPAAGSGWSGPPSSRTDDVEDHHFTDGPPAVIETNQEDGSAGIFKIRARKYS